MAANVKCPHCGMRFDKEKVECIHFKNRYWHKNCYDAMVGQMAADERDLKELEEYIVKLLKLDYVNARIKKQIKDMKASYGFTYSGIQKSLVYFYEVKGNSINKANSGIGIVPYVYEDAKKYFYTIFMAQAQNQSKDVSSFVVKGRIVKITPPQRQVKERPLVDIDAILKEAMEDVQ